jgi:hypothetical protein
VTLLWTEKWWVGEDFKFGFGATVISIGSEPRLERLGTWVDNLICMAVWG